jgi:cytolysin-activating lysine-acyltransferase
MVMIATNKPMQYSVDEQVGHAVMLMTASKYHSNKPIYYGAKVVCEAIRQGNMKSYYDEAHRMVAFVIWAFVDEATIERLLDDRNGLLSPPEWNEGESLWILDFVAPHGNAIQICRDLRSTVFRGLSQARYVRKGVQRCAH